MIDDPADADACAPLYVTAEHALLAEYHRFDRGRIGDAQQHGIDTCGQFMRRRDNLRAIGQQRVGFRPRAIPYVHGVPRTQQMPDHRRAHQARSTEADFHSDHLIVVEIPAIVNDTRRDACGHAGHAMCIMKPGFKSSAAHRAIAYTFFNPWRNS